MTEAEEEAREYAEYVQLCKELKCDPCTLRESRWIVVQADIDCVVLDVVDGERDGLWAMRELRKVFLKFLRLEGMATRRLE